MTNKISVEYLLFLIFLYYFLFRELLENIIPFFSVSDELIAISAIPLFLYNLVKSEFKIVHDHNWYTVLIVLFVCIGLLGNIIYRYQSLLHIALPDVLLEIKFWLMIYVGCKLFKDFSISKHADSIYLHVKIMTILFMMLFLLDNVAGGIFKAQIRYGLRSTQLFYSMPTSFACICVFLIGVIGAIRPYVERSNYYLAILLCLLCSTLRSKAIGTAFLFVLLYLFIFVFKKKINVFTLVMFIPVIALLAWNQIEFYFFGKIHADSARLQLLIKSVEIANDHFPLGAGFGTYASHFSAVHYSPLYWKYHLSQINGLQKGSTLFISDCFWPTMLGQTGWFGLMLMSGAIYTLYKKIQSIREWNLNIYVSALYVFLYIICVSLAESAFLHPNAMVIAWWLGILFAQKGKV